MLIYFILICLLSSRVLELSSRVPMSTCVTSPKCPKINRGILSICLIKHNCASVRHHSCRHLLARLARLASSDIFLGGGFLLGGSSPLGGLLFRGSSPLGGRFLGSSPLGDSQTNYCPHHPWGDFLANLKQNGCPLNHLMLFCRAQYVHRQ